MSRPGQGSLVGEGRGYIERRRDEVEKKEGKRRKEELKKMKVRKKKRNRWKGRWKMI
jgi:hypothetical protein